MNAIADRYRKHANAFQDKVAGMRPDQRLNQSPCEKWTAIDVVDHIISMHGFMLMPLGRGLSPAPAVQDDPLGAFTSARRDIEAVLNDPQQADLECDTPAGRMTVAEQIDLVVSDDMVLHGWDLAKAIDQDDTMDPDDVLRLWEITLATPAETMETYRNPEAFHGIEVYGPEVKVAADAPLQDRLLAMIGRDRQWTRP